MPRIFGMILADATPRGGTPAAASIAWISRNVSAAARAFGVSTGTSTLMRAGALLQPGLRHAHHVGALGSGKAAAAVADENHDGAIGLLDRDRMTQAIIVGDARGVTTLAR